MPDESAEIVGSEALNVFKFCDDAFSLTFGDINAYYAGLSGMVGPPSTFLWRRSQTKTQL